MPPPRPLGSGPWLSHRTSKLGEGDPALDPETLSDVFRYSGYLEQIGHMLGWTAAAAGVPLVACDTVQPGYLCPRCVVGMDCVACVRKAECANPGPARWLAGLARLAGWAPARLARPLPAGIRRGTDGSGLSLSLERNALARAGTGGRLTALVVPPPRPSLARPCSSQTVL